MSKKFLISISLFFCILILSLWGGIFFYRHATAASLFQQNAETTSSWQLAISNKPQPIFVSIGIANLSTSETIVIQSISFPKGLPAHVHVEHEAMMLGIDQPSGQPTALSTGYGWPPSFAGHPVVIHPLTNFQLGPQITGSAIVEFAVDQPGTYTVGPFTMHALLPGLFNSSLGSTTLEAISQEHHILCIQVAQVVCNKALQHKS